MKPKGINVLCKYSKTYYKFLFLKVMKIFRNENTIQNLDYVEWLWNITEKLEIKFIAWLKLYVGIYTHTNIYTNILFCCGYKLSNRFHSSARVSFLHCVGTVFKTTVSYVHARIFSPLKMKWLHKKKVNLKIFSHDNDILTSTKS